jgi:tetratricopeptide (TPR) repeat protein
MEHPDDIKDLGNDAMKAGNYTEAVRHYTRAIEIEANAIYFANRAAAQMKLGRMAEAVADGDRAIEAKRDYPKAYAQKGTALELLNRTEDAKAAYTAGLEACSGSELLKEKLRCVR